MHEHGNSKGRKVVVSGGVGFIGSHQSEEFNALRADVFILDNFPTGNKGNIAAARGLSNQQSVGTSVCETGGMDLMFEYTDVPFYDAGSKKNIRLREPQRDFHAKTDGKPNLREVCCKQRVRKFVLQEYVPSRIAERVLCEHRKVVAL